MAPKVGQSNQPTGAQLLGQLKKPTSGEGEEVRKSTENEIKQYDDVKSKGAKAVKATEEQTGKTIPEMQAQALQKGNANIDKVNEAQAQKEAAVQEGGEIAGANLNGQGGNNSDDQQINQFQQRFGQNFNNPAAKQQSSMIRKPETNNGMNGLGGPGAGFSRQSGGGSAGSTNDVGQLKQALGAKRAENGEIENQVGGMNERQQGIVKTGTKFSQQGNRFGSLKTMNNANAVSEGALKQAYGDTGKGLKSAAKGMGQASQVLQGVSQALKGAAGAVAAIPFVGPALSKALTVASQIVGAVGQAMKAGAQKTNASGEKMNQKSDIEKGKEQNSKAKTVANQLKETQAKDNAKKANQNAKTVDGHKGQAADAREANVKEQQELAKKIQENGGGNVTTDQSGGRDSKGDHLNVKGAAKLKPKAATPKAAAPQAAAPQAAAPKAAAPQAAAPQAAAPQAAAPKAAAPQAAAPQAAAPAAKPAPTVAPVAAKPAASAPAAQTPAATAKPGEAIQPVSDTQTVQAANEVSPAKSEPAKATDATKASSAKQNEATKPADATAAQPDSDTQTAQAANQGSPAKSEPAKATEATKAEGEAIKPVDGATAAQPAGDTQPAQATKAEPVQATDSPKAPAVEHKGDKKAEEKKAEEKKAAPASKTQAKKKPKPLRSRKPEQKQAKKAGQAGETSTGGGPSKHERALKEAAEAVLSHQGGGHLMQAKVQKLENVKKEVKDVAVSREVSSKVDEAYKKAAVRPTGPKLKVAEDISESGGAFGSKNSPLNSGFSQNKMKTSLNIPKLVPPKMPPPPQFAFNQGQQQNQQHHEESHAPQKMAS